MSGTEESSPDSTRNPYQIAICQNGKFAVTFNTATYQVKILQNTDYRPLNFKNDQDSSRDHDGSEMINKTIAHFEINDNFGIKRFYNSEVEASILAFNKDDHSSSNNKNDEFKWSFDISNLRKRKDFDDEYFILVAISCINVKEDLKGTKEGEENKNYAKERDYARGYLAEKKYDKNEMGEYTTVNVYDPKKGIVEDIKSFRNSIFERTESKVSQPGKGVAIYCLKLKQEEDNYVLSDEDDVDYFYSDSVSGICRFVDVVDNSKDESSKKKTSTKSEDDKSKFGRCEKNRFIILNFRGIYNFEFSYPETFVPFSKRGITFYLKEKFEYPKAIRRELDSWYTNTKEDCMKRLRSCIYDKYFLVTQYKNDAQSLEVYNLTRMELETTAKKVENKDKFVKQFNFDTFAVSSLQLCFTRGINRVRIYYIENGLQVASRKFSELERIYLLEFIDSYKKILIAGKDRDKKLKFIIWDLYNTDKFTPITLDECSIEDLDQTSGNILHVDKEGNVTSVLKKIEKELKKLEEKEQLDTASIKDEDKQTYYDQYAQIFNDYEEVLISNFKKIADDMEPWVLEDYKKKSYCLYYNKKGTETEFLQLIVGRSTVQIWHQIYDVDDKKNEKLPNKGDPFLEYIWTNGIPVDQECDDARLRVEDFKYGSNNGSNKDGSNEDGSNGKDWPRRLGNFSLKVSWHIKKKENSVEMNEEIKKRDIIETFHPIRHACKALKHLNKRYINKSLADNYNKVHKYEEILNYIKHIVWRFAKYNPGQFNLLDVRYNFMKSLILGDCDYLIKFILFGDEGNNNEEKNNGERDKKLEEAEIRHIPRNKIWPGKTFISDDDLNFHGKGNDLKDSENIKPENNMELAIHHCKGRELKDTIMIAYLLEYYSGQATGCAGWMSTVSKALPLLFKYNYDDYARKLFRKECFAEHDHFSAQDPDEIIPKEYLARRNHNINFRAFRPKVKLNSDKTESYYYKIFEILQNSRNWLYKSFEDLDNDLGKSPLSLRVVPLPDFTVNNIQKRKVEYNLFRIIFNILWLLLIPRWYRIKRNDKHKLSPFSRMILYENNDDIYDNPATEAVIDFCWQEAKRFFYLLFIRFLIFAICFGVVSWEYLSHNSDINGHYLAIFIFIFYYLAIFQLATEVLQLCYGPRRYIAEIYNAFDVISIVLSVTVMSIMVKNFQFSDGFGSVETADTGIIVGISFSIFFLWMELILYLRIISDTIGIYIYYSIIIFYTILPFLCFMFILVLAFTHTMFILLKDPSNISAKDPSFHGHATNASTNETLLNIELQSDFDPKSRTDNPFSFFPSALIAAYFWFSGNWVQRDSFDFWAVDVFTLIASIFLVVYLQNVLIAFMSGVFARAETKGRQTLLRQRANNVADYEALHHIHFWYHDHAPRYIYYFGQSKNFEEWYNNKKDDRDAIYKGFEEKCTFTKRIFKEEDYDKISILKNNNININVEIEKIQNMKNDIIDVKINDLIENFKDKKNDIEHIKNLINTNINYLIEKIQEK